MLTFQTDIDEHTGEQVLTCFLLPQLEYQNEQQGMTCNQVFLLGYHFVFVLFLLLLLSSYFFSFVSFVTCGLLIFFSLP